MALLVSPIYGKPDDWRRLFAAEMPELELRFWPEAGNPAEIEAAAVGAAMPRGTLKTFPNLRADRVAGCRRRGAARRPRIAGRADRARRVVARRRPDDERGDAAARAAAPPPSAGLRAGAAALRVDFAAAAARGGTQGRRHGARQHRARRRQGARPAWVSGGRLGELAAPGRRHRGVCRPRAASGLPAAQRDRGELPAADARRPTASSMPRRSRRCRRAQPSSISGAARTSTRPT